MTDQNVTIAPEAPDAGSEESAPGEVLITPLMQVIIEHMLATKPGIAFNLSEMCRALDLYPGTASPLLRQMHDAGWLTRESGTGGRIFYQFTVGTRPMLRKVLGL